MTTNPITEAEVELAQLRGALEEWRAYRPEPLPAPPARAPEQRRGVVLSGRIHRARFLPRTGGRWALECSGRAVRPTGEVSDDYAERFPNVACKRCFG